MRSLKTLYCCLSRCFHAFSATLTTRFSMKRKESEDRGRLFLQSSFEAALRSCSSTGNWISVTKRRHVHTRSGPHKEGQLYLFPPCYFSKNFLRLVSIIAHISSECSRSSSVE